MPDCVIESARCDMTSHGITPMDNAVFAEVKVRPENGESFFLSMEEFEDCPQFWKTEQSIWESLSGDGEDIPEKCALETGKYEDLFKNREEPLFELYRYLIYLVRSDWDTCEAFILETAGKLLSELEIPVSDIEEECMEEAF